MSSFDLLNLGNQALRSNQAALSTVGQNISNVNTPGYSRQVASFSTLPDQTGVQVDSIDRITNQFLTQQLWSDLSSFNQTSTYADMSGELDNLLATSTTSVSNALDKYFSALQNVVDDPVSLPNRELFVAESDAVVKRFNDLDAHINRQGTTINGVIDDLASQINSIASNIAELNTSIRTATSSGNPANELKDQREELTNQLSELVGIKVIEQGEQFNVFIGNGQPLVVGITASTMQSIQGDPDSSQNDLALIVSGNKVTVTDELSGGKVGGLLQYREESLNNARDELGRMAIGFAESMNTLHNAGMDLNNELGGDLFNDINSPALQYSRISSASDNQSTLLKGSSTVEIADISKLQASDYELTYDNDNSITLVRNSDGEQIRISQLRDAVIDRSVTANSLSWGGNVAPSLAGAVSQNITPTLNGVAAAPVAVDSAQTMAAALNDLAGVSGVTAETAINITGLIDSGGDGLSFDLTVNDTAGNAQTVSVALAAGALSDGELSSAINDALSADANDFSHVSISTVVAGGIKLVDSTGGNISVANPVASGDSFSIQNYASDGSSVPGAPVAVTAGQTGTVVGYLKEAEATIDHSVSSLSLSAGTATLIGATTVNLVDGSNNVESTRGDTELGTRDVGAGEFYLDPAGRTLSFQVDGMKVTLNTGSNLSKGDTFLIQPVRTGAEDLTLKIQDGKKLALASPVRITSDSDNQGTGVATAMVTNPDLIMDGSNKLDPPVSIVFNAPAPPTVAVPEPKMSYTVYDMSNPNLPVALDLGDGPLENIDYTSGDAIKLQGYDVTINNQPRPGDRFSFNFNENGVSDNQNALALSNLQQQETLDGGSYQDLYGSLIERVGTRTSTSRITMAANKAVLDSTVTAKSSVSGVNLDEEAAKLVQFQQAYQASAQLIRTSQTLFDTLLNSI
jgi:flagellar hook-associated protein FlgK